MDFSKDTDSVPTFKSPWIHRVWTWQGVLCRSSECSDYKCLVARGQVGQWVHRYGLWFLDWQVRLPHGV